MTEDILYGDFETRSTVDLKKCGADVYARDPSTDIMCFGWAFNDELPALIEFGEELPDRIYTHIGSGGTFVAHNASFELQIWKHVCEKRYGWPPLTPEQAICTMARAYAMSFPGAMEKLAPALGLPVKKDMAGNRTMLQLSRPRKVDESTGEVTWWDRIEFAEKYEQMFSYCKTDVDIERQFHKTLYPLSPPEKVLWDLDQEINQRGVGVDIQAIKTAIAIVEAEQKRLNLEMQRVTGNQVGSCNAVRQITDWLKFKGVNLPGVAKNDVLDALSDDGLDSDCRKALLLRQEAAKASTAKLKAMLYGASDGRIRGMFQYHGAAPGRWAGRRIQLHNLPRPKIPQSQIAEVFKILGRVAV